jgi:spore coat polysaccharide biosynthesis protein SpsF
MKTIQEEFWAGEFGDDYIARNKSDALLAANLALFSEIMKATGPVSSVLELGCNVGMNLKAFDLLGPTMLKAGFDINESAISQLKSEKPNFDVKTGSIIEDLATEAVDLTFTKGVLIHINPDYLEAVYANLYEKSNKYICVIEYYNPSPVSITYRGHDDRLFKRDFCGDLLDKYSDLELVDYGFCYRRDPVFQQDDMSWFLMKKA